MKIQFSALTAAALALLLSTACQREERTGENSPGELVDVSLSAVIPGQDMAVVRSSGDGSNINRCILEIYLTEDVTNGTYAVYDKITVGVANGQADFDLKLVRGQKYNLVLWADCATKNEDGTFTDKYYDTDTQNGLQYIVVDMDNYVGNDETRDAFYASVTDMAVEDIKSITLQRPFCQLNIFATDIGDIKDEKLKPKRVKIDFQDLYTGFNAIAGNVVMSSDKKDVSYSKSQDIVWTVDESGKQQMSLDYLFASAAPVLSNNPNYMQPFTIYFYNESEELITSYTFPKNIPLVPNYRTNVAGALLTASGSLNVSLDSEFNESEVVYTEEQLISALQNGGDVRLTTFNTILTSKELTLEEGKTAIIDLGGKTLTFDNSTMNVANSSLTFKNGKIINTGPSGSEDFLVLGEKGTINLDGVTIESSGSAIGIKNSITGGKIEIKNSTIKASGAYALSTKANSPNASGVEVIIENTDMTGATPLLINVPIDLTMTDCDLTGRVQGMVMRGGSAHITGGTITLNTDTWTADDIEEAKEIFAGDKTWLDGNQVDIAALTVGNKSTAYQYPTTIELKGTTLQVTGTYTGQLPAMYVWANIGDGLGVTITYDDATTFTGDCIYGNNGANITVNGKPAPQE